MRWLLLLAAITTVVSAPATARIAAGHAPALTTHPPYPWFWKPPALIYVSDGGWSTQNSTIKPSIIVFAGNADGNASPIREIAPPATANDLEPWGLTLDRSHHLFVSWIALHYVSPPGYSEYSASSNGQATPLRTVSGKYTRLAYPGGLWYRDWRIVVGSDGRIENFLASANGDVGPQTAILNIPVQYPSSVAVAADGKIYASVGDAIWIYASNAAGNVSPVAKIKGSKTHLNYPSQVGFDSDGTLYVTNVWGSSITEYKHGATGNVAPIREISGPKTGLDQSYGLAVSPNGTVFVTTDSGSGSGTVRAFLPNANVNVAPFIKIAGKKTKIYQPFVIAIVW